MSQPEREHLHPPRCLARESPDGRGVVRASWLTDLGALWGPLEGDESAGDVAQGAP